MTPTEFFDIYDSNNNPLNLIKDRTSVHKEGDWHRTSQVWVMNKKREVLCNLRSSNKDLFPCYWDLSIGGHVLAGDTYERTAQRELEEELGLSVRLSDLIFLSNEKVDGIDLPRNLIDREHARLFIYLTNCSLKEFKVQKEEIARLEFVKVQELLKRVEVPESAEFKIVPVKKHYIKILEILNHWDFD